jgi:hypothetical protein
MLPPEAQGWLDEATKKLSFKSRRAFTPMAFESHICGNEWDRFIEAAALKCYRFLQECLGPFQREPLPLILPISDGFHVSGANASFEPATGQVRLCPDYVVGRAGTTLEKICHELTHASLNDFPEGDPFYEEGVVDYSVWVMAHAPWWGPHREAMIEAASHNIAMRRERAMKDLSDYDRKRWAGGLFCATVHGPWVISKLRMAKAEGNLKW